MGHSLNGSTVPWNQSLYLPQPWDLVGRDAHPELISEASNSKGTNLDFHRFFHDGHLLVNISRTEYFGGQKSVSLRAATLGTRRS